MRNFLCLSILVAVVTSGCVYQQDQQMLNGVNALKTCDVRTADADFVDAYAIDPSKPDAAPGFALTELAVLAEDPAVAAALAQLGCDEGIDTSAIWAPGVLTIKPFRRTPDEFANN